jgi:hypothetical protein
LEVEQSENVSADSKLFSDATNLTNNYSKDLDKFNLKIGVLKNQFAITPAIKLAQAMKSLSRNIKEDPKLNIFKLPTKLVHEVNCNILLLF